MLVVRARMEPHAWWGSVAGVGGQPDFSSSLSSGLQHLTNLTPSSSQRQDLEQGPGGEFGWAYFLREVAWVVLLP